MWRKVDIPGYAIGPSPWQKEFRKSEGSGIMSDFDITFNQPVTTASYVDILARGPEKANCLTIVSGVINCEIEVIDSSFTIDEDNDPVESFSEHHGPDAGDTRPFRGNVLINTSYILDASDQWKGIVQDNSSLLQTTYACFANIHTDNEGDFIYAIDAAYADIGPVTIKSQSVNYPDEIKNELVVHLQVGLQNDATLAKIYYQVHLLLQK